MNKHSRQRTHSQLRALERKRLRRQRLRALQRRIGHAVGSASRDLLRPAAERPLSQSERISAYLLRFLGR